MILENKKITKILFSVLVMFVFTAICLLILSFVWYKTKLADGYINIGIKIIYVLSGFTGGFLTGKAMEKRAFMWGMLTGLIYYVIILLVSLAVTGSFFSSLENSMVFLALCLLSGMFGGMIS